MGFPSRVIWTNTTNHKLPCSPGCYRALYCRTDLLRNSFLPFSINEWKKLDPDIRNLDSHTMFRKKLLTFIRPSEKSIYNIYDPQRSKLLNRFRLGFSHLREHKFRHNFADTGNPLLRHNFADTGNPLFRHNFTDTGNPSCSCALETESKEHFFLRIFSTFHSSYEWIK